MKIHEMLCEELVKNSQFRSEFLEYARGRVGVFAEGPIAGWPMEGTVEPPAPEPIKVEWRMLLPNETIQKGDQWAPLAEPERWRPVGDSVGRVAGEYRNSHFRRDASLPMTVRESANPSPSAADSVPIVNLAPPDLPLEAYETIHFPGGAARYRVGLDPDAARQYNAIDRRDGIIVAASILGAHVEAGEGYRILEAREAVEAEDEYLSPFSGWQAYTCINSGIGRAATSRWWDCPIHRRRIAATPPTVNPPHDNDWIGDAIAPNPITVRDEDAERRRAWRLLEPHETVMEGDRYANPYNTDDTCAIGPDFGITAGEHSPRWPVIRRIVTERGGYRCPIGSRIMDPEETVPDTSLRNSVHYDSFPQTGERVGDRIIFFLDVVEVPDA